MNRALKRLGLVLAAVTVGVFATATPALAHHPIISGTAVCQANGTYDITWTVGNGNWGLQRVEKILEIATNPNTAVTGFGPGTWIAADASVTGHQTVPGTTTSASLWVKAHWYELDKTTDTGIEDAKKGWATGLNGQCEPEPDPTATFVSKCDGTVNVHITNPGGSQATFNVSGTGFNQNVTIAAGGEKDVTVPAGAGKVTVKKGDAVVDEFDGWTRPENCPPPTAIGESTCDGFWVKITNPQGGMPVDATVTYGTQTKNVTVAPGKTEAVSLSPSSEAEAGIAFSGGWPGTKAKYEKPGNCPGLPQTGANTTTYVGTGAGLVALGAVVFFLARRRLVQLRRMAAR